MQQHNIYMRTEAHLCAQYTRALTGDAFCALNNQMFYKALRDKHGWTHEWIICDPGDKSFA